jgi:hypothetical protein
VEGRVRNGISAYEAGIFSPSTPGPDQPSGAKWKLDPTGKPVWNTNGNSYGDIHSFLFSYTPATGTSVWSIDFNRDGDYNDAKESVTNVAPTLAGKGFQYISILGQGNENGIAVVLDHFTINGVDFGSYSSSSNIPFSLLFEDVSGIFNAITITGQFSFSGYSIPERPRIWVRLGESNFGAPTCALINPIDGTIFNPDSTIFLEANAIDSLGKVVKVEFYDNETKIGEDLTSPYTLEYSTVPSGMRILRAKAFDNHQAMTYSAPVTITGGCIREDINMDGVVNTFDFLLLLSAYGNLCTKACPPDINDDGIVDTFDFLRILARFGYSCN